MSFDECDDWKPISSITVNGMIYWLDLK